MNKDIIIELLCSLLADTSQDPQQVTTPEIVLVRARNAGVHYGTLTSKGPEFIELENSRRIWSWAGAFTLSEVSQIGVDSARVAESVPSISIPVSDLGEIIPMSKGAINSLNSQKENES